MRSIFIVIMLSLTSYKSHGQNSFYLFELDQIQLEELSIHNYNIEIVGDSMNLNVQKFNKKSLTKQAFLEEFKMNTLNTTTNLNTVRVEILNCYTHFEFGGFWNSVFEANFIVLDESKKELKRKHTIIEDTAYNWNGFRTAKKLQNNLIKNSFIINDEFFKNN